MGVRDGLIVRGPAPLDKAPSPRYLRSMPDDHRYDWRAPAALGADRRTVERALAERGAAVTTLLNVVPALLRLVAASELHPDRASPGFSLARDHGARGWVASVAGAVTVWSERHDDAATALRLTMQRVMNELAALDA